MMESNGFLPNVQGIEQAEEELLHVVNVIELRLHDVLVGALAIQALQYHACGRVQQTSATSPSLPGAGIRHTSITLSKEASEDI